MTEDRGLKPSGLRGFVRHSAIFAQEPLSLRPTAQCDLRDLTKLIGTGAVS
jgi:hypothetical protein